MNPDTLVVVHCYAGDKERVEAFLPQFLHHECPVLILSPEDAPVEIDHPGVTCRSAGKAGWKGAHTVHRQIAHWKIAAEFPQRYFLMNDSDSVCITPDLHAYLYEDTDVEFWCNVIGTHYLNYEPPYFFDHDVLDRMIDVAENPGEEALQEVGTLIRQERGTLERLLAAAEALEAMTPDERYALPREDQEFAYDQLMAIIENPHTLREELEANIARGESTVPDWGTANAIDGLYVAITTYLGLRFKSYPDGSHGGDMGWLARERKFRLFHAVKTADEMAMLIGAYNGTKPGLVTDLLRIGAAVEYEWPREVIREEQGGLAEGVRVE